MISIIIPFYNEKDSLPLLVEKLKRILKDIREKTEIIYIDDGSTDGSRVMVTANVELIHHRKKLGKGRALLSGFELSKGDVIVFMDADLQDDPAQLPKFLGKIRKGYDLVNGWRHQRHDPLSKTLPSAFFNFFIGVFFRTRLHDLNCGFKAMRREVLEAIPLYGDNYRFLPMLAQKEGFKIGEVEIVHHPRKFGKSKYGAVRLIFGFLDLMSAYFVYQFSEKPLHFFGFVGGLIFMIGFIVTAVLIFQRIFYGMLLYRRPALSIGILMIIVGVQIIMTGIIGELIVYLKRKKE